MRTHRRLFAALALALTITLCASACIGYAPSEVPRASRTTTFIFHPGYKNTGSVMTPSDAGDPQRSYAKTTNRRVPTSVAYGYEFAEAVPGTKQMRRQITVVEGHRSLAVPSPNGSYSWQVRWSLSLCSNSNVKVAVRWSDGTKEVLEVPVASGILCPGRPGELLDRWAP